MNKTIHHGIGDAVLYHKIDILSSIYGTLNEKMFIDTIR